MFYFIVTFFYSRTGGKADIDRRNISPPNRARADKQTFPPPEVYGNKKRSSTMSEPPKRIIIEKSRAVRRKYLRRNNTFQYTASQIARIDREEERERRAEQLREKEKRRVANKKKRAQKEAEEREERRRQGAPDPHVLRVPSSQPLLSNFLAKPKPTPTPTPSPSPEQAQGPEDYAKDEARNDESDTDLNTEPDTPGTVEEDLFDSFELDDAEAENLIAVETTTGNPGAHDGNIEGPTTYNDHGSNKQDTKDKEEDEFSDCSAFYDEDFIREAELVTVTTENKDQKPQQTSQHLPVPAPAPASGKSALEESFRDDAADALEEFACGFDETIG